MFSYVFADGEMICVDAVDANNFNFGGNELLSSKLEVRYCTYGNSIFEKFEANASA
jgi:hypothetical protein